MIIKVTPVEALTQNIFWKFPPYDKLSNEDKKLLQDFFDQAKQMEKDEKAKHQIFIGSVSEIIGIERTIELIKEANKAF